MATGIVFHYTSSGALPSIVTSGTETIIRATGIEYLNDQSELHTGLELVSSILTQEPHILELDELAINALRNTFFEDTLETFSDRYYVACFSCATGLVDQWRGYGENGIGFALGFTRSRYISRPALSEARLELTDQGMVRYALKTAYRDGTTHVVFEPLDFMAKLAALVPRPRTNLTRFHGVLAPNSRYREQIIPTRSVKVKKPLLMKRLMEEKSRIRQQPNAKECVAP